MCFEATCGSCNKVAWRGCGNHVASVLDDVPAQHRCTCEPKFKASNGKEYPPAAKMQIPGASWVSSFFGGKDTKKGEL